MNNSRQYVFRALAFALGILFILVRIVKATDPQGKLFPLEFVFRGGLEGILMLGMAFVFLAYGVGGPRLLQAIGMGNYTRTASEVREMDKQDQGAKIYRRLGWQSLILLILIIGALFGVVNGVDGAVAMLCLWAFMLIYGCIKGFRQMRAAKSSN